MSKPRSVWLVGALVVAACGAEPVVVTAAAPSTTVVAVTTTATTTTVPRSEWCLERDAGAWTEPPEPRPYDRAPLEAEKAERQRRLDRTLAQQLGQTDVMFNNMAETHADDPEFLAEIDDSHRSTRATIQAQHREAVAQLEARYERLHREARQSHVVRQERAAELAAREFRNELQRYELECQ